MNDSKKKQTNVRVKHLSRLIRIMQPTIQGAIQLR